jgi:hypothetical protein
MCGFARSGAPPAAGAARVTERGTMAQDKALMQLNPWMVCAAYLRKIPFFFNILSIFQKILSPTSKPAP